MTDREKLIAVFESFSVELDVMDNSIRAARRRFYFDKKGQVEKIIDYRPGHSKNLIFKEPAYDRT